MNSQNSNEVVVVDIKMRFLSMVVFMVKWVIASIPALIILGILWVAAVAGFHALFGGGGAMWWHGPMMR